MPLPALEAHLICVALVATDVWARALRLKRILRALSHEVPLARLSAITLSCDAACALTPYRAGGDAVRVASLARSGVSLRRAMLAIACEAVQVWPTVLLCGIGLAWFYGAEWWGTFATGLGGMTRARPWSLAAVALALPLTAWLGWCALRRVRRRGLVATPVAARERLPFSMELLRATLPLTFASVAARVLILPVLAATLADAPPFGQSAMGSFALLHSQLVLPLPAGAGAVDLGFLAGAQQGARVGVLLVSWRLYTSGLGLALGLAAIPITFRRRAPKGAPPAGPVKRRRVDRGREYGYEQRTRRPVASEMGVEANLALAADTRGARSPPPVARA
jgi:uncharacterized membrane protein YbhN (UPF0104 family)